MQNLFEPSDDGAYAASVRELVHRGRRAQAIVSNWADEELRQALTAVAWLVYKDTNARQLSELSSRETGMGSSTDSCARLQKRVLGTLSDLQNAATVGMVEENIDLGIQKFAKPVGLIAVTTPATAPVASIAVNALSMLATRNAVIFCPNPRAKETARITVALLRKALSMVHAPLDLFQCVAEPTREQAVELMSSADLVVASGGERTVRRARMTGTPTYGAGVGNAVVIVDDTANLSSAARLIVEGKAFDNGTSCSSESAIVVSRTVWSALKAQLELQGAYLCDEAEGDRVRAAAWPDGKSLSRDVVGKSALWIAKAAGVEVPQETRVLMVVGRGPLQGDALVGEKLCPILGVWLFDEFGDAVELVQQLTELCGRGHSCGIHSSSASNIERVARDVKLSRVMVNQSTGSANTGNFDNGMPFSVILSCGTWGGDLLTDNIHWRHFLNYTWVSKPIKSKAMSIQQLFSEHWRQFGK